MSAPSAERGSVLAAVRLAVRELTGYKADTTPAEVVLDANECAFPLPDELRQSIDRKVAAIDLRRYPDPEQRALKRAIADRLGLDPAGLVVGNGSDELIAILITAFGERPAKVLFPTPTFAMYEIIATCHGVLPISVPLSADFDLDVDRMIEVAATEEPKLIFLASPNNPTGRRYDEHAILRLLEETNAVVVVDEAYADFCGATHTGLLAHHDNLVVMRTLSKVGLAALRVGYLATNPLLAYQLNKVRLPYNVGAIPQAAATAALNRWGEIQPAIDQVVAERDRLATGLGAIGGVVTVPSDANFILFRVARAAAVHQGLLEQGVRIKLLSGAELEGYLRVTVGQPHENQRFLAALTAVVEALEEEG